MKGHQLGQLETNILGLCSIDAERFPPSFQRHHSGSADSKCLDDTFRRKGGALSQHSQVLYGNPKLVTVTLLRSGKEVGGWTGGEIVAKPGWKP